MSSTSKDYEREKRMRSLDTIAVYNPTSEDFLFWQDRYGPAPQRVLVPKAQRDIGHGKGIAHLPRYQAEKFTRDMIVLKITKESDEAWKERKKELRMLPKNELLEIAKNEPVRTNNPERWNYWFPKIWLGVVEKFGGETLPEPPETKIPDSGDPMKDAITNLGLADKPYEPVTQE